MKNCRNITKSDMKYNDLMPKMRVDPESYVSHTHNHFGVLEELKLTSSQIVEADGIVCTAEPAETLPLTQGYFVY